MPMPKRIRNTRSSRGVSEAKTRVVVSRTARLAGEQGQRALHRVAFGGGAARDDRGGAREAAPRGAAACTRTAEVSPPQRLVVEE